MPLSEHDAHQLRLGESVLRDLRSRELPAIPEFYKLLHAHHSGYDQELSHAIRQRSKAGRILERNDAQALYEQFFNDGARKAAEATSSIVSQLREAMKSVSEIRSGTEEFGQSICRTNAELETITDVSDLCNILETLTQSTTAFAETTDKLAEDLASREAEVAKLQAALKDALKASRTDALTGVGNRGLFDDELKAQIDHAVHTKQKLALLMVDIDHFKKFNDTHGHQMGDIVIKMVASQLKSAVKGRDIVARYGGEEFAVILSGANAKSAAIVANQICQQLSSNRIVLKKTNKDLGVVTASIGVAEFHAGLNVESLIAAADGALYQAKNNGRNRVEIA